MVIKNNLVDFYSPSFASMFVGFDRLFDSLSRATEVTVPAYPPTNVSRDGENYTIEMALAGLDDNDIDVEVQENTLTIMHESSETKEEGKLFKGIAQRSFRRQFKLADDIEVVGASLKNGLLCINLTRFIPDEKKPKKIKIES